MELVTELMGVDGGRAVDYAQIEREMAERTAAVERAPHQSLLAELDVMRILSQGCISCDRPYPATSPARLHRWS